MFCTHTHSSWEKKQRGSQISWSRSSCGERNTEITWPTPAWTSWPPRGKHVTLRGCNPKIFLPEIEILHTHQVAHISEHVPLGSFYLHYPWVKVRLEFHFAAALMTAVRAWKSHNLNIWGGFSLALLFLTWNGTLLTVARRQSDQSARQQVRTTGCSSCRSFRLIQREQE